MAQRAPASFSRLTTGCTVERVRELERALGAQVPGDLRASLRRHDGEPPDYAGGVVAGSLLLGCEGIESQWRRWNDLERGGDLRSLGDEIRADPSIRGDRWWRVAWIPFVGSDGSNLCVDLDPGPEGTSGQVILMDRMYGPGPVVAPSHAAWLSLWADDLEADVFVPDGAALVNGVGHASRSYPEPPPPEL